MKTDNMFVLKKGQFLKSNQFCQDCLSEFKTSLFVFWIIRIVASFSIQEKL